MQNILGNPQENFKVLSAICKQNVQNGILLV